MFVYALAMSGIEVAAGTMIQGFQYSKYEDDVELRVKSTLRRMLNDVVGQRAEVRLSKCQARWRTAGRDGPRRGGEASR